MIVFAWILWSLIIFKFFMNFVFLVCAVIANENVRFGIFNVIMYIAVFVFLCIYIFGR